MSMFITLTTEFLDQELLESALNLLGIKYSVSGSFLVVSGGKRTMRVPSSIKFDISKNPITMSSSKEHSTYLIEGKVTFIDLVKQAYSVCRIQKTAKMRGIKLNTGEIKIGEPIKLVAYA